MDIPKPKPTKPLTVAPISKEAKKAEKSVSRPRAAHITQRPFAGLAALLEDRTA